MHKRKALNNALKDDFVAKQAAHHGYDCSDERNILQTKSTTMQ